MKRHIPNFLTSCNLLCGAIGVIYCFEFYEWHPINSNSSSPLITPAIFVWMACIFDFLDGFVAKALKVSSAIGKELDSLADVVSFGLLPSIFMYKQIQAYHPSMYLEYIALAVVVFSAIRLAVFNIDTTQSESFKGLPTPANALFLTGLPFIQIESLDFIFNPTGLVIIWLVFCLLLISRIDLFALKFKHFKWKVNEVRFTFLLVSVLLLSTLKFAALSLIILLYIFVSLSVSVVGKNKQ
jgi:CDP-diacylglycerol--serine O-phosphatidyltransferase